MLKSILLGVTGAGALVLRRGDVEAVAQGEGNTTGIVVLHLAEHHAIAIKREAIDASIEKVIACEFDVKATFAEVLADTKRKNRISTVEIGICTAVAVGVHVEVSLNEPVVRKRNDVAQLQRQHGLTETLLLTQELRFKPRLHQ